MIFITDMVPDSKWRYVRNILFSCCFFLSVCSHQIVIASDPLSGSVTLTKIDGEWEYFSFSTGETRLEADTETYKADIRGTSNEGVNFGNEDAPHIEGRRVLFLGHGTLGQNRTLPEWNDEWPWMNVSWELSGQPLQENQIWGVHTRDGHYAVMQITSVPDDFGEFFTFDYIYLPNGSRVFGEAKIPNNISVVSGDNQQTFALSELAEHLVVRVLDEAQQGLENIMVFFTVIESPPEAAFTGYFLSGAQSSFTGTNGEASIDYRSGNAPGEYTIHAQLLAFPEVEGIMFKVTVLEDPQAPESITASRGIDGISLTWSLVEGIDLYYIYRNVNRTLFDESDKPYAITSDLTLEDIHVDAQNMYAYRVTAVLLEKESEPTMVVQVFPSEPFTGSGTSEDPYVVPNIFSLNQVRLNLSAHYILAGDIDASDTRYWNNGAGFEPMGTGRSMLTGLFDGNGHAINNLYIDRPDRANTGLFDSINSGGKVTGLELIEAEVTGWVSTGGIAGAVNGGEIAQSHVTGEITSTHLNSGGIAGACYGISQISESYANVTVRAAEVAGGLVGLADCSIINSYAWGEVTVEKNGGGLVGLISDWTQTLSVVNSYAAVMISGAEHLGGLIGGEIAKYSVISSYWHSGIANISVGVASGDGNGIGALTEQQMQDQESFEDWDFDEVWIFIDGISYPILQFQPEANIPTSATPGTTIPVTLRLKQNYPNPFNPTTTIAYDLPTGTGVVLEIFDVMGRRVATLVSGQQTAGSHQIQFDASRLASGIYMYRLQAGEFVQIRQMMLVK